MNILFLEKEMKYTGAELSPHFIYKNFHLQNDSMIAFIGEVDVDIHHLVDIEDVINNEPIYSQKMLNFIIEFFEKPLLETILIQRLLICIIKENLEKRGLLIERKGDDLFFDGKKLSVSIATKSTTSTLIHTGINICDKNTPIPVSSLSQMGIDNIKELSYDIMNDFKNELVDIDNAKSKVRGV